MIKVLYEDNHLLGVEKPVNMPVNEDSSGDHDLLSECKAYLKEKYQLLDWNKDTQLINN